MHIFGFGRDADPIVTAELILQTVGFGDPPLVEMDDSVEYDLTPNRSYRRFGQQIEINRYGMRSKDAGICRNWIVPRSFPCLVIASSMVRDSTRTILSYRNFKRGCARIVGLGTLLLTALLRLVGAQKISSTSTIISAVSREISLGSSNRATICLMLLIRPTIPFRTAPSRRIVHYTISSSLSGAKSACASLQRDPV